MSQDLCPGLGSGATEDLLHRPEAGVVESFREGHNVGRGDVLVLLRPGTARQLVRLDGREYRKVQQRDLVGQLLGGDTQRTANDRVYIGEGGVGRETVGLLR